MANGERVAAAGPLDTMRPRLPEILDSRPMAILGLRAKMAEMNPSSLNSSAAAPRRFILLPEESIDGRGQRPPIRRYYLSSVGRRPGRSRAGVAAVRNARELGRLD
ncbi:MAG TPA: hypothetical protein VN817_05465, partial [Solirubrobacteraceae bacterium]|nr:hypothetical protein [Solirubrobacteraceae bacterium]